METIKTFNHEFSINGQKATCLIRIKWDYEPDYPIIGQDFDLGSAEENMEYIDRFGRGELSNVWVKVEATFEGIMGSDSVGGCHIFNSDFEGNIVQIVDDHQLTDSAIENLIYNIMETYNSIKQFYKGA